MKKIGWVALAGGLMVLVACGGGGLDSGVSVVDSSAAPVVRISGVVARGAALVEAKVTARCVAGPVATATSGSSGAYTLEVTEGALPCVLEAVSADGVWTLHSVATPAANTSTRTVTAHITPLTELLVAQLAGTTPASFMAKATARTLDATITLPGIASAQATVGSVLKLMGVNPAPITDALAQPLVAASAVQRGNAHDKVLDALAAAMVGAGAGLPDLVGLVTSRARMLEHVGDTMLAGQLGDMGRQ